MTLTELSYFSRRFLPVGVIILFVVLILYYALRLTFILCCSVQPPPQLVFNTRFGQIKKPVISDVSANVPKTYTLDTIEGQPVTATEAAKIYFVPQETTHFGYRSRVISMGSAMGFDTDTIDYRLVNEKEAQYSDASAEATIDITTFNYHYIYNVKNNPSLFDNAYVPEQNQFESKAADYLKSLGTYPDEFAQGKTNDIFMRYDPATDALRVVNSAADANMVEVDFYKPDIEGIPVVAPKYFNSQNYVVLVFNDSGAHIAKSQVKYFRKSDDVFGLYPVKTGVTAWEQLKAGKGYVVSNLGTGSDVKVSKMFLAYLDLDSYAEYLQPVYVFLGNDNFVGYVPAIEDKYLAQ